jgi:hypothetical protein
MPIALCRNKAATSLINNIVLILTSAGILAISCLLYFTENTISYAQVVTDETAEWS